MSEQKIALVTGATRGIGRAIAETLAQDGFIVIGTATSENGASTITQFLQAIDNNNKGVVLNVDDGEAIAALIANIQNDLGTIDVLVNNAGITRDNLMLRMSEDEWDAIMLTNLKSVFRTSKGVLKGMMKKRAGRIINISSVVGSTGNAGQVNYAAAKAGIAGFTKSMALEVASRGITVNAVAPGFIATDMTEGLKEEQKEALLNSIPLHRLGQPQDIADAVSWLASDKASYITGQTIHVNGGMYMA